MNINYFLPTGLFKHQTHVKIELQVPILSDSKRANVLTGLTDGRVQITLQI